MATLVTKTVKASGGDYTSLVAAEAGEQTVHSDLVSRDEILRFECYAFKDSSTSAIFDGWTCDATRYLDVFVPVAERHNGRWNTAKYRLIPNDQGDILRIKEEFVHLTGLQIGATGTIPNTVGVNIGNGEVPGSVVMSKCIIRGTGMTGTVVGIDLNTNATSESFIWNNIIYDCVTHGVNYQFLAANAYLYNNTVYNCGVGIDGTSTRVKAVNNLVQNCTTDYTGTFLTGSDYNGDEDNTAPGSNSVTGTATFFGARNFHLDSTDTVAKGAGVSDPGSGLFSDDIDGTTRSDWSIGATEAAATPTSPVLRDAVSNGTSATVTSLTATGITPSGTNRYGIVKVAFFSGVTISDVTWGGTSIVANVIKSAVHDGSARKTLAWFYYLNPPTSTANVVVTLSGAGSFDVFVIAEAWSDVHQSTPYGSLTFSADDNTQSSYPPSLTVSSAAGECVVDSLYYCGAAGNVVIDPDTTQVVIEEQESTSGNGAALGSSFKNGAASVAMAWTNNFGAGNWVAYAVALKPSYSAPPTAPTLVFARRRR